MIKASKLSKKAGGRITSRSEFIQEETALNRIGVSTRRNFVASSSRLQEQQSYTRIAPQLDVAGLCARRAKAAESDSMTRNAHLGLTGLLCGVVHTVHRMC